MGLLAIVNVVMASLSVAAYVTKRQRSRAVLHGALAALSVYGLIYVWATPTLDW